ncbi:MAG: nuclear transport factor 2 family protein [Sandaracinaceae bacterium]|nr:nuclear transport factor 2 family protein [Sandaracinaceae bacterium]
MTPTEVVQSYFAAMQTGRDAADALFALFVDDAVYVEPFTGASRTHEGRAAIEACIRESWDHAPPDLALEVNRIDVDGDVVRSEWTCTSPVFEAPVRGVDVCTVRGGRIARLEVSFA